MDVRQMFPRLAMSLCQGVCFASFVLSTAVAANAALPASGLLNANVTINKVTPELERKLRGQLAAELGTNSKLQGAWVKMVVPPDRAKVILHPIFDEKTAADQKKELAAFLKKKFPNSQFEILPHKTRPITKFLQELQSQIEAEKKLGSCLLTGAYYQTPVDGENFQALMLLGRVSDNNQKTIIVQLSSKLKSTAAFREAMQTSFPKPDEMKTIKPSKRVAKQEFRKGQKYFRKRNYPAAQRAFDKAVLEDPKPLKYRYWRVLAYIADDNIDVAKKQLAPLVRMRRDNPAKFAGEYDQVQRSMEKVPGLLRIKLKDLEE